MDTAKLTYLVTGATGFLGSTIMKKLLASGERVRGFDLDPEKAQLIFGEQLPDMVYGDVRHLGELARLFEGDGEFIVIHTAAIVSIGERRLDKKMYDVNVNGTLNILKLCKTHAVRRLVYVSSVDALPENKAKNSVRRELDGFDPKKVIGAYGKSKAIASEAVLTAVREQGLDAVIVQPGGVIGPQDHTGTHTTEMMLMFLQGRIPSSIDGQYSFVDVRDVADGIIAACTQGRNGACYFLTGESHTVNQVFEELALHSPRRVPKPVPMWVAWVGLPVLWMYFKVRHKRPLYTALSLRVLSSNCEFSHDKASAELGFEPRPFSDTVRDIYRDFVDRGMV